MGCNCKNIKKVEKMLLTNDIKHNKLGLLKFVGNFSINIFNKLFIILLMIILVPIVMIYLIIYYILGKQLIINFSDIMRKINNKTD